MQAGGELFLGIDLNPLPSLCSVLGRLPMSFYASVTESGTGGRFKSLLLPRKAIHKYKIFLTSNYSKEHSQTYWLEYVGPS